MPGASMVDDFEMEILEKSCSEFTQGSYRVIKMYLQQTFIVNKMIRNIVR